MPGSADTNGGSINEVIVTDPRSLLQAFQCASLEELEDQLDAAYDASVFIELDTLAPEVGIVVRIGAQGTGLEYPFAIGEIWACLDDLDALNDAAMACEEQTDEFTDVKRSP